MLELNNKGVIRLSQIDDVGTKVFELTNLDKLFDVHVEPEKGFKTASTLVIKIHMVSPLYENKKYWQRLFSRTTMFTHDLKNIDYVTYINDIKYIFRLDVERENEIISIFLQKV